MKKSFNVCFIMFVISTVIGLFVPSVNFMVLFNNIWYLIFYFIYVVNAKINTMIINSSKTSQELKDNSINQMSYITGKLGKSIFIIGCIFIQIFFSATFLFITIYGSGNSIAFGWVVLLSSDFIVNNVMLLFIVWNIIQIIANILFIIALLGRMKQDKIKLKIR